MDNHNISRHISGQFNAELEAIRTHVLAMGGLVERQLTDALRAMHNQDVELARHVIREDHKVNGMEVAIDEACTRIIAKRQPTASDLRLVMAIIKTITDLERIGDVADSIAKMALDNSSYSQQPFLVSLEALGQRAAKMLHDVLDAFARMDIDAAMKVYRKDDSLDREYEGILRQLMTYMMEDPRSIPNVLKVMWSARAIERVGDRCQNICEYIIYFVKGKDVRHIQKEELEKLLK
ncbi:MULTISPECIES: phosphate signaling complex protein PhoU [Salinivibrio]|uniref:Phosphate-specific transport system accessory protein PhoU n=3 Tax=Salinivibrio TaxID=51366 RepID=A0AB36K6W9_9GAMM|nr:MULTISPECIES: phosphate signaling complex protein PhoU [Salinivibrio]KKA44519.1 transcriptional regulator PhoU [Salinivibrio sp. KP-1]MPS33034.1 phosphate transport system regulator PhoU [Salinivibrio sp. VYel7]MPX91063.1 phosphate signaling complex protein PhoU [Salinivibrio sp. VYel1]MPX94420.1 phosphate signaling complex protein PhoU [Salinivibrio sp. VYel9]MPX96324.1 phosphate signaling complex protein PhoU [Salinivibrio sp. VYel6]